MYRLALILFTSISLTGCLKEEFAPLEGNIFEERNTTFFELLTVTRDTLTQTRADITVTFYSDWENATPEQRATITALQIVGPRGDMVAVVPPETTTHIMRFARFDIVRCLELTFLTVDETNTKTTEICVRP